MPSNEPPGGPPIVAFCHIPKTGGSTVTSILRAVYGLGHCRMLWGSPESARRDIELVRRTYPHLRAISGHPLRPFVDYGSLGRRFRWFTMLRDPIARLVSHYRYTGVDAAVLPFADWCAREVTWVSNRQVRLLAGAPDVERAKAVIREHSVVVGDQSDFDTSLRLFATRIGDDRFPTSTTRVDNSAPAEPVSDEDRAVAAQCNTLDLELYAWFRDELWPEQTAELTDADRPFADDRRAILRRGANRMYHGAVYRPLSRRLVARGP